jgi:membrane carboxypeptidase/penicillin-binding protein
MHPPVNEVIDQQTARTMMTLLRAVTQHGTGAAAAQLNHPLGGKTGTTSDFTDAWFLGFSPSVTCGVWVGYDSRQSLGEKETGAKAALPIWMRFPGDEESTPLTQTADKAGADFQGSMKTNMNRRQMAGDERASFAKPGKAAEGQLFKHPLHGNQPR